MMKEKQAQKVTSDGFKVVDSIPSDDSDISDAFESCSSEYESCDEDTHVETKSSSKVGTKISGSLVKDSSPYKHRDRLEKEKRVTEDGFKIVSNIPSDDSDVSDAFESDLDEDEWLKEKSSKSKFVGASSDIGQGDTEAQQSKTCKLRKPLLKIMDDFGITKQDLNKRISSDGKKSNTSANNTTFAASLRKQLPPVEIIDHSKKRGSAKNKAEGFGRHEEKEKDDLQVFIKASKHDIFKLGMSGFDASKRKDAKVALAVKLGAKPPKNKVINYKELQKQRKEEKQRLRDQRELDRRLGNQVSRRREKNSNKGRENNSKPKKTAPRNELSVGKFKDGVLKLSKHDLKKIKGKR